MGVGNAYGELLDRVRIMVRIRVMVRVSVRFY